jgi:hypothetical protein
MQTEIEKTIAITIFAAFVGSFDIGEIITLKTQTTKAE